MVAKVGIWRKCKKPLEHFTKSPKPHFSAFFNVKI